MQSAFEANQEKSCAIGIRGKPKLKSCAISIRGELRLSHVPSESETNQMKSCANRHPRQTKRKKKNQEKRKRIKRRKKSKKKTNPKKSKRKKRLFSIVLDKICVFCLYPIPDSQ